MMAAQCFVRSLSVDEQARHQRLRPCADGSASDWKIIKFIVFNAISIK